MSAGSSKRPIIRVLVPGVEIVSAQSERGVSGIRQGIEDLVNRKIKILVADDDRSMRALYDIGLSDEEFEKRFATNGAETLAIYTDWAPDIIVLDIMMPELSGYSVLKEIRETRQDKTTTIIMATAISGRQDVMDCLRLGIQGYLVKPFRHAELREKIFAYHVRRSQDAAIQ